MWRVALLLLASWGVQGQTLDLAGARLTFDTGFTAMPRLRHGPIPHRPGALDDPGFVWLAGRLHAPAASDMETYPDGNAILHGAPSPFTIVDGALAITARPRTAAETGLPYVSGALSSYPFGQTYGYFEMTARLPRGQGLWPAFWLLPVDDTWPPEIDVVETLGHRPATDYTSLHTSDPAMARDQTVANAVADTSDGFHRYGVDWGKRTITFYFDSRALLTRPTPSDMHKPFYLTFNLAVGGPGSWPGPPDATTAFPARMLIRSIKVWQRP